MILIIFSITVLIWSYKNHELVTEKHLLLQNIHLKDKRLELSDIMCDKYWYKDYGQYIFIISIFFIIAYVTLLSGVNLFDKYFDAL